jgi:hypothetical protein
MDDKRQEAASAPPTSSFDDQTAPPPSYDQAGNQYQPALPYSPSNPSYAPSSNPYIPNPQQQAQQREQTFRNILGQYEISENFSTRLQKHLVMTKIVFIFDDSGSMNSILTDSPLNTNQFKVNTI